MQATQHQGDPISPCTVQQAQTGIPWGSGKKPIVGSPAFINIEAGRVCLSSSAPPLKPSTVMTRGPPLSSEAGAINIEVDSEVSISQAYPLKAPVRSIVTL